MRISGGTARAVSRACNPSNAVIAVRPLLSSMAAEVSVMMGSSSTTSATGLQAFRD